MAGKLEAAFQALVDEGKIHGAILCARDASGSFKYARTFGSRTLLSGEKKPHQMSDILYMASCTKLLTSIAALQCVEDGLLSLTSDVSHIAPELKDKKVLTGYSEDGTPILEAQKFPITLELLLTHSSGLLYAFMPEVKKYEEATGEKFDGTPFIKTRTAGPLGFQPGQRWAYGHGIDWAGLLVERVSGQKLGDYLNSRVFKPFAITRTSFWPVREDLKDQMVDVNPTDPQGEGIAVLGGMFPPGSKNDGDHFGGHGIYMSGEDFMKVLGSLLADDGKLLKPDTAASMFKPHLTPEAHDSLAHSLRTPPLSVMVGMGMEPDANRDWGLGGILIEQDFAGWFGKGTLSWGGGMNSTWFIDRKNALCGFTAPQIKLPINHVDVVGAKHLFRTGIYDVYQEWKSSK